MQIAQEITKNIVLPWSNKLVEHQIEASLAEITGRKGALIPRSGVKIDCFKGDAVEPERSILIAGLEASAERLNKSGDPIFSKSTPSLLDVGCGMYGSLFAHALESRTPGIIVRWLDHEETLLSHLDRHPGLKYCADARSLPFPDKSVDIILISGLFNNGLTKERTNRMLERSPTGFEVVKEAARVLSPGGLSLIEFNDADIDRKKTLSVLQEAGYVSISHVHQVVWNKNSFEDLYACRTAARG